MPDQLEMIWPRERLRDPPTVAVASGYALRTYEPGDEPGYAYLMERAGFGEWDRERIEAMKSVVIPGGLFLVVDGAEGNIVSTAGAHHRPCPRHPLGGELGWVATDPAHRGRGLGAAASGAAVARFLGACYERIYLKTDDFRAPAIKLYVKMGFVPYLFSADMPGRWKAIAEGLGFAYTPERWPGESGIE
jgi:mycothiol synthase